MMLKGKKAGREKEYEMARVGGEILAMVARGGWRGGI